MITENQLTLKERLRELIGESTVKAALFYTFNFDPKFFENYVLPVLIPGQQFLNNTIVNNIIWRRVYKDNAFPDITVYYDQYAKSHENGPMLPYQVCAVNMASVGKNKGNFHPKHTFILIETKTRQQQLIILTGSNNMTQGGWCENRECVSELTLINNEYFPQNFVREISRFVTDVHLDYNKRPLSTAEEMILSFLRGRGTTRDKNFLFYHSFQQSFDEFLQENVLNVDTIHTIEIMSPFFVADGSLSNFFLEKKIAVHIQAPLLHGYCLIKQEIFEQYKQAGVRWFEGDQARNDHSKVYRLFSDEWVYTITGSVNFTAPAWQGALSSKKTIFNIESAVIFWQKNENNLTLLKKPLNESRIKFAAVSDPENTFERQDSPVIDFVLNWRTKELSWKGKTAGCVLHLSTEARIDLSVQRQVKLAELPHANNIMEDLAKRCILKVVEGTLSAEINHYYYPLQYGYEQKPIEYRLSATDIIEAWEVLGDEDTEITTWLLERLESQADNAQDESGNILSEVTVAKSLLNEMARHLYGLIQLEKHLYETTRKGHVQKKAGEVKYYLTSDNVDTLPSYVRNIHRQHQEGKMLSGYYWLLLSVISTQFYSRPGTDHLLKEGLDHTALKEVRGLISEHHQSIENMLQETEQTNHLDRKKLKWVKETLMQHEQPT
jgi:hypothetical protein